jgi:biotin synthesis protein BioG
MRAQWITHNGSKQIVLFLNGCGMDARILTHTPPPEEWDMLMLFNYQDLLLPAEAHECLYSGATVVLVAWSMGVWAAGTLADRADRFAGSVAINGTATPVHDLHGIPPVLYHATVTGFSEENRRSFYRRMCGSPDNLRRFLESAPERDISDQHNELAAIEAQATSPTAVPSFPFKSVIVGMQDRIIPSVNMQRFWEERGGCCTTDMPHFPFFHLSWKKLITHAVNG